MARSEFCTVCERENHSATGRVRATNSTGAYVASHHGHQCRYGRCTSHCECTRDDRQVWLGVNREQAVSTARCYDCGITTAHFCLHETTSRAHPRNKRGCSIVRRCGRCCKNPLCVSAQPCSEFVLGKNLEKCVQCLRYYPSEVLVSQTPTLQLCYNCNVLGKCVNCNVLYDITLPGDENIILRHFSTVGLESCPACHRCRGTHPQQDVNMNRPTRPCCRCIQRVAQTRQLALLQCGVYDGFLTLPGALRTHPKANPTRRSIGIEFEIAGFVEPSNESLTQLYNTCRALQAPIGTDASIRSAPGTSQTVEIRTAPAGGLKFVQNTKYLLHKLNRANAVVNHTCGMHVHVGVAEDLCVPSTTPRAVTDVGYVKIANMLFAWRALEEVFFKLIDTRRGESAYCRPLSHHDNPAAIYMRDYPNNPQNLVLNIFETEGRYSSLNIMAIRKYGTVEYRLHHASLNPKVVIPWAILLASFTEMALSLGDHKDFTQWVNETDPVEVVKALAPTRAVRAYIERTLAEGPNVDYYTPEKHAARMGTSERTDVIRSDMPFGGWCADTCLYCDDWARVNLQTRLYSTTTPEAAA